MPTKLSRYCEGLLEAIWLAAVIIIPVFFNIYSSRIFEPDKATILRSLALLVLGAWLVKIIEEGGIHLFNQGAKRSWLKTIWTLPMFIPVMALIIVYLLATLLSISPQVSIWGSYQRLQGTYTTFSYLILFVVIVGNMRRWAQIERLITTIIVSSLPVTLYGLLQRYGMDPIPWAGNTTTRIAANMGNSIFVAAYLIMVVPLTGGRLVKIFKTILSSNNKQFILISRASIYTFIFILQLLAIFFSQSRGPVLGLLIGGFLMALLLTFTSIKRWMRIGIIGLGALAGVLLLVFNIERSILQDLRDVPGIGRFGMLLDPESTTALTRKYIWKGAADLVGIHASLKFPDGGNDPYNSIRPLIGYGPESMYVAFNQFYPPELGSVEKRNASPDRSHNETWDALIFTGILGLFDYLLIFGSIFYYGVKWLGLIKTRQDIYIIFAFMIIGGIGGSVGFSLWRGIEYFGIGLPFGLLSGLLAYFGSTGLRQARATNLAQNNYDGELLIVILLSAIVAHFIEINFGIAIVATRMLFWIYAGLLIVVGHVLPVQTQNGRTQLNGVSGFIRMSETRAGKRASTSRLRKVEHPGSSGFNQTKEGKHQIFVIGLIISIILVTLSYNYIINPQQETNTFMILINSLTRLSKFDNAYSMGVLGLFGITWISGSVLLTLENEFFRDKRNWVRACGAASGISAIVWLLFSVIFAGKLALFARNVPHNQYDVLSQVDKTGSLLAFYYFYIGIILVGIAVAMVDRLPSRLGASHSMGIVASAVFLILIIVLINMTNLRVVNADIAFKMAEPFVSTSQWKMATLLYEKASEMAPMEDHYYLFLGRSYLEQAKAAPTLQEQDDLISKAIADLSIAQRINPLNTDHTANLARLYSWWASKATDTMTRVERGNSSDEYFEVATTLSPNNMAIWGEWAILNFQVLGKPQTALELLNHAIAIDPNYSFTQGLMGDFYSTLADATEEISGKIAALEQASNYYREAVRVHTRRDTALKSTYLVSAGNTYLKLAGITEGVISDGYNQHAIEAFVEALNSDMPEENKWQLYESLARVYADIGDRNSALTNAQLALSSAPYDASERIAILLETIKGMP